MRWMAVLSYLSHVVIEASPSDVFDFCSDLRNELAWNSKADVVEKLTDGPVDVGTRYRAHWSNAGDVIVEMIEFDRSRSWATRSSARGMDVLVRGTVGEEDGRTRYTAHVSVHPRGLARLYAPLAVRAMRRQEAANMRLIKNALE